MTYAEAKLHKEELENICDINSKKINSFEKGEMGLTPKHIKILPEYKLAKQSYENSFAELRKFNEYFVKTFKKEYANERQNKRKMLKK